MASRLSIVLLLLLAPLALLPGRAVGQTTFEFRGYAKNLGIRSSSFFTNDAYVLDVSRLRGRGLLNLGAHLHGELWLDTELLLGSFLDTPDYALGDTLEPTTFLDLDWSVKETGQYHLRQRLFRAFATLYLGQTQATVGRQRIAWGTGFAWNPTDLFNPFNPGAVELDEKAGIDAAHVAVPFGAFSRVEAAVAPGRRRGQSSAALRAATNVREYDVSLMGGFFRDDWVLGGDFAGYVGDAGFRGEAAYTWNEDGRNHLRAILNADYNFAGGYYVLAEVYYNGQGTRDKDRYDLAALLAGETFNVARDYLAASVAKAVTPLVGAAVYSLVNLDDRSALVGPSVTYSLAENLEVAASTYVFAGAGDTEFGAQSTIFFGALQFYF